VWPPGLINKIWGDTYLPFEHQRGERISTPARVDSLNDGLNKENYLALCRHTVVTNGLMQNYVLQKGMFLSTQGQIIVVLKTVWIGDTPTLNSLPEGMSRDGIFARNQKSLSSCGGAIHD